MVDGFSVVQMTALYIFGTWSMLPYNADCGATRTGFGLLISVQRVITWHVVLSLGLFRYGKLVGGRWNGFFLSRSLSPVARVILLFSELLCKFVFTRKSVGLVLCKSLMYFGGP